MSRKAEYLAQARRADALAERITDPFTRETIVQAADSWRLLASLEDGDTWRDFNATRETTETKETPRNRSA
jgi:hypothetical protein